LCLNERFRACARLRFGASSDRRIHQLTDFTRPAGMSKTQSAQPAYAGESLLFEPFAGTVLTFQTPRPARRYIRLFREPVYTRVYGVRTW